MGATRCQLVLKGGLVLRHAARSGCTPAGWTGIRAFTALHEKRNDKRAREYANPEQADRAPSRAVPG